MQYRVSTRAPLGMTSITAKLASGAARSLTGPRERAGSASASTMNTEPNITTIAVLVINVLTFTCNGLLSASYGEMVQADLADTQRASRFPGAANRPCQTSASL